MHMNSVVAANYRMMTNSNKLRTYSTARFFLEDEILRRLVYGLGSADSAETTILVHLFSPSLIVG